MKIKIPLTKQRNCNKFRLALITENAYFYANYHEGDDNGNTMMFNKQTDELISNNYFANSALTECIINDDYIWISRTLKKHINDIKGVSESN